MKNTEKQRKLINKYNDLMVKLKELEPNNKTWKTVDYEEFYAQEIIDERHIKEFEEHYKMLLNNK